MSESEKNIKDNNKKEIIAQINVDIKDFDIFKQLIQTLKEVQGVYPETKEYIDIKVNKILKDWRIEDV